MDVDRADRRWVGLLCLAGLVMAAAYWIDSLVLFGPENIDLKVLYRHGDLQYYPLIEALARLDFSPTYSPLTPGDSIISFPIMSVALHAISFAAVGVWGFVVSDVVLVVAAVLLIFWCLRRAGIGSAYAAAGAVLLVAAGIVPSLVFLHRSFHGMRIPRPLVSSVHSFVFLYFFVAWSARRERAAPLERGGRRTAIGLAVGAALVLQSDVYMFVMLVTAGLLALAARLILDKERPGRPLLEETAIIAGTFLLCCIPFLLQRLWASPDLTQRLGVFPLEPHDRVLILKALGGQAVKKGPLLVLLLVELRLLRALGAPLRSDLARSLAILAVSGTLGTLAFFVVSPSAVQILHFWRITSVAYVFPLSVASLALIQVVVERVFAGRVRVRPLARMVLPALMILVGLGVLVAGTHQIDASTLSMRDEHFPPRNAERFRRDLGQVMATVAELPQPAGRPPLLLTNDHHVMTWWALRRRGLLLMPDVFTVTLDQRTIERQLINAAKFLGWNEDQFIAFLAQDEQLGHRIRNSHNTYFLGHNMYQATPVYTFTPLEDYDPNLQDEIRNVDVEICWQIVLPESEKRRLRAAFRSTPVDERLQPDVVVLLRSAPFESAPALGPAYCPVSSLENYFVFVRQQGGRCP